MEVLGLLAEGLGTALTPMNLVYVLIGCLVGSLVGVLPGLGPSAGIAIMIPITYSLPPVSALIMLSGLYYGCMFGGSTSAILLNVPGESSSVMTAVEGYPLAKQGRAGVALGMSAISSFVAGTAAVVGLMLFAIPMSNLALRIGPPETFALVLAVLTLIAGLSSGSVLKGLAMGALGIVLATVGLEPLTAQTRLHFGIPQIRPGIDFVAASVGLFGLPEALETLERKGQPALKKVSLRLSNIIPTRQDFRDSKTAFPLGFLVGFPFGVLPGLGANAAGFAAHASQRRISKKPELFGNGSIEAIAAIEGSNNAAAGGSMVPMMTLGIPGSGAAAVLMGAFILHGLQPGPLLFTNSPDVAWGVIASMYIANVMLLILNLPLIGMWVTVTRLPPTVIMAGVLTLSVVGVYSLDNSVSNVYVMFAFGILGFFMRKFGFPAAPIILALILTNILESSLHRSLVMGGGSWSIFVTRPVALLFILLSVFSVLVQIPSLRRFVGGMFGRSGTTSIREKILHDE